MIAAAKQAMIKPDIEQQKADAMLLVSDIKSVLKKHNGSVTETKIISKALQLIQRNISEYGIRKQKVYTVEGEELTTSEVKQFILDRMEYSSMSLRKIVLKYSGLHVPASLSKQNSFSPVSADTIGNILKQLSRKAWTEQTQTVYL